MNLLPTRIKDLLFCCSEQQDSHAVTKNSPALLNKISDDVLVQIFILTSLKSQRNFRSISYVSKKWNSVVKRPELMMFHIFQEISDSMIKKGVFNTYDGVKLSSRTYNVNFLDNNFPFAKVEKTIVPFSKAPIPSSLEEKNGIDFSINEIYKIGEIDRGSYVPYTTVEPTEYKCTVHNQSLTKAQKETVKGVQTLIDNLFRDINAPKKRSWFSAFS